MVNTIKIAISMPTLLEGSPVRLSVVEEANKPIAYGEALRRAQVGRPAQFVFDSKKQKGGLKVEIHPQGMYVVTTNRRIFGYGKTIFFCENT